MGEKWVLGQAESYAQAAVDTDPDALKGLAPMEYYATHVRSKTKMPKNERRFLDIQKREVTPEDIGCAVVFFASEESRNITGQSLTVDGGKVSY